MTAGEGRAQELRAVVFDMDGVLIDTEPEWRRVEIEVFGRLGVPLTEADCRATMGLRVDEVVAARYRLDPWQGPGLEEVATAIVDGVIAAVRAEGRPMPGATEAIAMVRDAGLGCAVASSSSLRLIRAVLDRLELAGAVDVVCSAENEAAGKPAPDVYLSAARGLGVDPRGCLAIEDSVNGWLSADAAGMPCVLVPDSEVRGDPRLVGVPLVLDSLAAFDEACLARIRRDYFW